MAETTPQPSSRGFLNGRRGDVIRILIADDHEMVRRGLRHIIVQHEGWRVCGEAATGREAVELATKLVPNVVILDLTMPGLNGVEATRRIKASVPSSEVLIFSMYDSLAFIHRATEAGARGYLVKSDFAKDITAAIEALAEHKVYFTSSVSKVMLDIFLRHVNGATEEEGFSSEFDLTMREREVVQLLTEGHSNKSAAQQLNISAKTVETHRQAIMDKLNIHSVAGLVRFAARNRMIVP